MVNAGSLITRMELLPSNLKGTFPFFAVRKNVVFNCFLGSRTRPREPILREGNERSHLSEQHA